MKDNFLKFGRSGCTFYLEGGGLILQKISKGVEYNERLYNQYLKQSKFQPANNFYAPQAQNFNMESSLYQFDMEYIHGKTFELFCIDSNINEIKSFSDNLKQFIRKNLNNSIITEVNFEKLNKKIRDLKSNIKFEVSQYVDYLLSNKIDRLPIGKDHGDLTMSNIIFSDKYYLIDFLDNPFETPLNDLVKIKQDTEHNFYFNLTGEHNAKVKICLDYINNELDREFSDVIQTKEFIWISIFNLLRVLPYLTREEEQKSVIDNLKKYEYCITSSRKVN